MTLIHSVRGSAILLFCCLWFVIGRTDLRDQKIRNRHLLLGAVLGLFFYGVLLAHTLAGWEGWTEQFLVGVFYRDALLHVLLSVLAALLLWWHCLWPAGDAKLFILLSALLPILRVTGGFDPWRSPLLELINIFIPAACVLLVRSSYFVWQIHLRGQVGFLTRLGWTRLPAYLLGARESLTAARARALEGLAGLAREPGRALLGGLHWGASMAVMSAVVAALGDRLGPTWIVSGLCFLFMLGWKQVEQRLGSSPALGIGALAVFLLFDWRDPRAQDLFLRAFSNISVFSLSIQWGVGLAHQMLRERGFLIAPLLGLLGWGVPLGVLHALGGSAFGSTLLTWSLLGGFFGLSLVLVRILEEADRPTVPPEGLTPFLVLAPAFIEKICDDPELEQEHFDWFYADGLTPRQASALRSWCEKNAVALVPLRSTVSFAGWIFLGIGLTWVMNGHVLQFAY